MAIETIHLSQDHVLPPSLMAHLGVDVQQPIKAVRGNMGVLLLKESASLSDILFALEEMKTLYANELKVLDREWDDFTLSEELLNSNF